MDQHVFHLEEGIIAFRRAVAHFQAARNAAEKIGLVEEAKELAAVIAQLRANIASDFAIGLELEEET